ncbi:MAG: hypothetical protein VB031_06905 [Eubacteriaceae bacterium]|nr:hypothetical protein [Eubacteriaceae bacterium]
MELGKIGKLKKTLCNKRGELLVEGLASFVILVIILATAAGLVFAGINMNKKADDINQKAEANAKIVSNDTGTKAGDGIMMITVDGKTISEGITVKDAGDMVYFTKTSN